MGTCPFCKAGIGDDALRAGGRCPKCGVEISDDDVPTDPGVRAKARVRVESPPARRRVAPGVAAFLLVSGLGSAASWFVLRPEASGGEPADSEELYVVPLSRHRDLVAAAPEAEPPVALPAEAPPPPAVERAPRSRPRRDRSQRPSRLPPPEAELEAAGPAVPLPEAPAIAESPLGAFSVEVGPGARNPRGVVLGDPVEVRAMVQRVLDRGGHQLQQCYQQRLKGNPDLAGAWRVAFRVGLEGRAEAVLVRPMGRVDTELEACLARNVESWTFQAVGEPFEISKTYRFGGEG